MADNRNRPATTALVLGGGGPVGIAWMAGLLSELRRNGIDLSRADSIIGTSAGSVVGAVLRTGDIDRLAAYADPSVPVPQSVPDLSKMMEILAVVGAAEQDPARARRRVGELALAAEVGDPAAHIARMRALIGESDWPPTKKPSPPSAQSSAAYQRQVLGACRSPVLWQITASGRAIVCAARYRAALPGEKNGVNR
ncbi:patatin-like phospholipase family protein [Nocardia sp. NPDC052566]|uniref:patatin-like phospholipase family protein n=1 Tax=Nocardia sp. NPDC052566 TaxID=3364330 RepID=UPI0037CA9ADF